MLHILKFSHEKANTLEVKTAFQPGRSRIGDVNDRPSCLTESAEMVHAKKRRNERTEKNMGMEEKEIRSYHAPPAIHS